MMTHPTLENVLDASIYYYSFRQAILISMVVECSKHYMGIWGGEY